MSTPLKIVFLCTGNASRSVMAGAVLAAAGATRIEVVTAGTHVVEGQPIGRKTRAALADLGLRADRHRSRQVRSSDLADAHLVVGFASEHVAYVRRRHPEAAARTATIRYLCSKLQGGRAPLEERVAALRLDEVRLEDQDDVTDPAGGDEEVFDECAREVRDLVEELVPLLGEPAGHEHRQQRDRWRAGRTW